MDDMSFSAASPNMIPDDTRYIDLNSHASQFPHVRSIRTRIENGFDILQQSRKSDKIESPALVEANLAIQLGQSLQTSLPSTQCPPL